MPPESGCDTLPVADEGQQPPKSSLWTTVVVANPHGKDEHYVTLSRDSGDTPMSAVREAQMKGLVEPGARVRVLAPDMGELLSSTKMNWSRIKQLLVQFGQEITVPQLDS